MEHMGHELTLYLVFIIAMVAEVGVGARVAGVAAREASDGCTNPAQTQ